jgi:mannose-6-phosphate isomerase-like protein (cupin superfamily)
LSALKLHPAGANPEFATSERCHITELLNAPGTADVSIARARVEPGVVTQLHSLRCREVYVVLSGTGRMDDGAGGGFPVGPGDVVEIPPGVPQRIANTGEVDLIFLCVCTPRFVPDTYRSLEVD